MSSRVSSWRAWGNRNLKILLHIATGEVQDRWRNQIPALDLGREGREGSFALFGLALLEKAIAYFRMLCISYARSR